MNDPEDVKDDSLNWDVTPNSPILRYFKYDHLSPRLQEVSVPFSELAHRLDLILPNGPEKSVALRKLLEGKDAAVRSALDI
jgi:hypothetical protein